MEKRGVGEKAHKMLGQSGPSSTHISFCTLSSFPLTFFFGMAFSATPRVMLSLDAMWAWEFCVATKESGCSGESVKVSGGTECILIQYGVGDNCYIYVGVGLRGLQDSLNWTIKHQALPPESAGCTPSSPDLSLSFSRLIPYFDPYL